MKTRNGSQLGEDERLSRRGRAGYARERRRVGSFADPGSIPGRSTQGKSLGVRDLGSTPPKKPVKVPPDCDHRRMKECHPGCGHYACPCGLSWDHFAEC